MNRWLPLVKWLLAIPHYIVLFFLSIRAVVAVIVAWFAILFTGTYPRSLFDHVVGLFRWGNRVTGHSFALVTDQYPPFQPQVNRYSTTRRPLRSTAGASIGEAEQEARQAACGCQRGGGHEGHEKAIPQERVRAGDHPRISVRAESKRADLSALAANWAWASFLTSAALVSGMEVASGDKTPRSARVARRRIGLQGRTGRYFRWRCGMDLTTLVVDFVILLLIVAVAMAFVRAWRMRPARLIALPPEARSRYAASWDRIEKHFMDAPEEAVQQADALTAAMLGESGHPLAGDRLPGRMLAARRKLAEGLRRHRTEDLRLAMLDYRSVLAWAIGPETPEPAAEGRRETA